MTSNLRTQALERMQQLYGNQLDPPPDLENHSDVSKATSIADLPQAHQNSFQSLLNTFGIDRDRLILLIVLIFLYYDKANPKILLAILYIML